MRTVFYILQKEFLQIFRNRAIVGIMFIMPIVQLLIFVHAATLEMKNINLYVIDNDLSGTSRRLVSRFEGSPFFNISGYGFSVKQGEQALIRQEADAVLCIPSGFEKKMVREKNVKTQLLVNAINGTAASLIYAYSSSIIFDYSAKLAPELIAMPAQATLKTITVTPSFWYNPLLDYKIYMVPGILVILVTIVGMFLTGLNLVREKEMGTTEQINVTPIKKYQFIIGKLLPFWIIALIELGIGIMLGRLMFDVPLVGSIFLVFFIASIYLIVVLGFGLFMSTFANTQQQLMFLALFFMLVFMLMSGIFTSTESMPEWALWFNLINPIAYLMKALRMIMLKGSTLYDVRREIISLFVYGILIISLSVWRYRKTTS